MKPVCYVPIEHVCYVPIGSVCNVPIELVWYVLIGFIFLYEMDIALSWMVVNHYPGPIDTDL
jgi:hypothetical protein